LRGLIPENQTVSEFYLQLSEKSNPKKIYAIKIPIIERRKNVTAIFLKELPQQFQNGTYLPIELVAQMNDITIEVVGEKNIIKPSDFDISIQKGGNGGNGTTVGTPGRPEIPGRAGRNQQSGSDVTVTFVKT
jgi:hypothetical protein